MSDHPISDEHWSDELIESDKLETPHDDQKGTGLEAMGTLAGLVVGISAGSASGPPGTVFGTAFGGLAGAATVETTTETMRVVENEDIRPSAEGAPDN